MLLIIASIYFGRLNKIRVKSKISRNEKKGHGGKQIRPKKWSGARRLVRPATTALNLSIYAQNFFKFCIHIVIGDEWYGIVNGQNPTIFDGVTALSPFKKWFLACYSFTVYDI